MSTTSPDRIEISPAPAAAVAVSDPRLTALSVHAPGLHPRPVRRGFPRRHGDAGRLGGGPGGHREPFVARWPAAIPAGLERDDPVGLVDLLPTIATAVGTGGRPDAEDGRDILDVLTGAADVDGERVLIHHSLHGMFAVRRGPWKAVFGTGSGGFTIPAGDLSDDTGQLYDLAADPAEAHNLWAEHPDVVAELRRELDPTPDSRLPDLPR